MTEIHQCVMKDNVKEMTDGVKNITIDVALMKNDVSDLKSAMIMMSGCVKTLSESSLVAQQNNITRDKFYEALNKQEELISDKLLALAERLTLHENAIQKYPTPDAVDEADKTLQQHQTYFKIIWIVVGFAWVLLIFILDKMWVK